LTAHLLVLRFGKGGNVQKQFAALGWTILCGIVLPENVLAAEERPQPPGESPPSIQRQLDDLKHGQQRLQQELDEIKKLLREKQGSAASSASSAKPKVFSLNVHNEPFRGDRRAKVAIMEYSDFECSYCAKFVQEIYPKIDQDYIKCGKVKYFFRDLPAREHPNAMAAAQAARCAGDQGKFWEMHDLLFASRGALAQSNLLADAQGLGLDTQKFSECLSNGYYAGSIRLSIAGGKELGIYGTPAFVLGTLSDDGDILRVTKVLVGGESDAELRPALDELLAGKSKAK
jgi:protein-disulfide isomerase